jgi:EAL domain-containing protein (putative c-di-GMP-specific phosphodiesterase class I)
MLDDKEALGIVHSVVRLAAVFNRRVIAEGVETLEHWRTLLDMDCDFGQGYGIARPMPADQFPAWVAQWRESGPWREFVREEK